MESEKYINSTSENIAQDVSYFADPEKAREYLVSEGYDFSEVEEIKTEGATDCVYYKTTLTDGRTIFIKAGEKVDQEVQNIAKLNTLGVHSIPSVERGSSSEIKILVTEFLEKPNFGFETTQAFHNCAVTEKEFLDFQNRAFDVLTQFYSIPVAQDTTFRSEMFDVRMLGRLQEMLNDNEVKLDLGASSDAHVSLHDLLDMPIQYTSDEHCENFSSVIGMCNEAVDMTQGTQLIKPRVIHGDFHAPNIALNSRGETVLIDMSDVRYKEDPAWDLGKWLNYIERFHRVAPLRAGLDAGQEIELSVKESGIELRTHIRKSGDVGDIRESAVEKFSEMLGEDSGTIAKRAMAAEFVVNISTLRRHARMFPNTVPSVLSCICNSFTKFRNTYAK